MAKQNSAGSATLPKRITAFVLLFGTLVQNFEPITAFIFAVSSTYFLSRL